MQPPTRSHRAPDRPGASGASGTLFWIRRYGVQEAASIGATVVWCWAAMFWIEDVYLLGLSTAAMESAAFYAVAFVRQRRGRCGASGRSTLRVLLLEYGAPEALDLALRPLLVVAIESAARNPVLSVVVGSYAADAVFYVLAARGFRRHLAP